MGNDTENKTSSSISIGGKLYDAHTGLPLAPSKSNNSYPTKQRQQQQTPAKQVHTSIQKSRTLHRTSTPKRPEPRSNIQRTSSSAHKSMDMVPRSSQVRKFSHETKPTTESKVEQAETHHEHPKEAAVHQAQASRAVAPKEQATKSKSNQAIKEEAIKTALKQEKKPKKTKTNVFGRHPRLFSVVTGSAILLLLVGYLMYTSMPSLSVRIAAAQSGVSATYPSYKPDGYRLMSPVGREDNRVVLHFSSNTNDRSFTIYQQNRGWDSNAVRDMVDRDSNGQFITTQDRGLTIYTYDGNAAWVNRGILYTLESNDAQISSEQIRLMAASF